MTNTFSLSRQSFLMRGLLFVARHMSHGTSMRLLFRDSFSKICNFNREFKTKSFRGRISIICRSSVAAIYQNKPLSPVSFFNCRNGLLLPSLILPQSPYPSILYAYAVRPGFLVVISIVCAYPKTMGSIDSFR